ncbi:peptidyl-tRNA hydrolase [Hirsutella rhossiliensis]|uniref:peptidyl-tRNA hydrolase n=1 Tax=Hirsutella rhossiliensis TaxID=111463 RepID=A0A9P8N177_9HYPO|nr:peptidyl-tRNA hydrolase domain-containing protein [Hirsutella rhossiliensis]KAH0964717.1 peptidyl-tRNA hydrolase domain-containing protein [Hirsutella rhossiliensis]
MINPHFLIISLGNPLPAYSTLHSAGHFANRGLAQIFRQPEWRERRLGRSKTCLVSQGPKYTLVQSPTLMNRSGDFALGAWKDMCDKHDPASLSLVILHDELEKKLGDVALIHWTRSARGHNGVKDVLKRIRMEYWPTSTFARISIGIGRPPERDQDTVVRYVMKPVSPETRGLLEDVAPFEVARALAKHEENWRLGKQEDQSKRLD